MPARTAAVRTEQPRPRLLITTPRAEHGQLLVFGARDEQWLDPAVVALSCQRPDGEWHYCPWLTAGRDDLYDEG